MSNRLFDDAMWERWGELTTDVDVNGLDGLEPEDLRELAEIAVVFRNSLHPNSQLSLFRLLR